MKGFRNTYKKGATSIYVVIFTTLLISVITVSFIRIMIGEQQSALEADLSQSAYDSALAGVEDAKTVLLKWQNCQGVTGNAECDRVNGALGSGQACNNVSQAFGRSDGETFLETSSEGDAVLEQAYTCVMITTDTENVERDLQLEQSWLVPLYADSVVSKVQILWFERKDSGVNSNVVSLATMNAEMLSTLPSNWPVNRPGIIRAQLIAGDNNFSDLESLNKGSVFLYPAANSTAPAPSFNRNKNDNKPYAIQCNDSFATEVYACSATIDVGSISAHNTTSFLRLTAMKRASKVEVRILNSAGGNVKFVGVQPIVDATGRANDMFRRVLSRVELHGPLYMPEFAVDMNDGENGGVFCKLLTVTDDGEDALDGC